MCVMASRLGGFGAPPALVVSGPNAGLNTGRAILHSGTVGAALTAQNFGMSGLAVSAQGDGRAPWHWDTAAQIAVEVIDMVLAAPPRSVVNLNVPALPRAEVKGVRWARLAPFGEVRMTMSRLDPVGADDASRSLHAELQLADVSFDPDTDTGLVRDGYAALTTLVGVVEAWPGYDSAGELAAVGPIEADLVPGADVHESHRVPDADEVGVLRRPTIGR
jgi:5'-nucleotidase